MIGSQFRFKYASYTSLVRRKCRQYRQQQTHVLLGEVCLKSLLNGPSTPLPKPRAPQQQGQLQQYMADYCS